MIFTRDNGPATPAELSAFEAKVGALPDDYRAFILKHNGVELSGTASLRGPERWPVEEIEGTQPTDFWEDDYPPRSVPVAHDGCGNVYLMSLDDGSRGRIFFLDHEKPSALKKPITLLPSVASSFSDFLARLEDFDPDDPESEELFRELAERRRKTEEQRRSAYAPKKPWWRFW